MTASEIDAGNRIRSATGWSRKVFVISGVPNHLGYPPIFPDNPTFPTEDFQSTRSYWIPGFYSGGMTSSSQLESSDTATDGSRNDFAWWNRSATHFFSQGSNSSSQISTEVRDYRLKVSSTFHYFCMIFSLLVKDYYNLGSGIIQRFSSH